MAGMGEFLIFLTEREEMMSDFDKSRNRDKDRKRPKTPIFLMEVRSRNDDKMSGKSKEGWRRLCSLPGHQLRV